MTNLIVGDSLQDSNNCKFSTLDQDNDGVSYSHGATEYKTAGWANNCFRANINGHYANYEKYSASYLSWYEWNKFNSLKTIKMMIRPQV